MIKVDLAKLNEDDHIDYKLNYIEDAMLEVCDLLIDNNNEYPEYLPQDFEKTFIIAAAKILANDELKYQKENVKCLL
jgi:hypothetical protein